MTQRGPDDEDAVAVRQVLSGDLGAFRGIVERWQGRLINLAWRFCRDRSLAEDMAQEAFVRAFKALATFRRESAFSTWLTAIAMNTYRTSLRDRAVEPARVDPAQAASRAPDALAELRDRERSAAVRQLVLTLPRRYREPMVLYYFQEMNLAETARILGLPEGTLKARLHRGRTLLRRRAERLPAIGRTPEDR